MSEALLDVEGLQAGYGGMPVLNGVSLRIDRGEIVAIVGGNGAGKTTLLRALAGLVPASAGTLRCFGRDPATADRRETARDLAYLPQVYELAFPFVVEEVVLLGRYARMRGLGFASAADVEAARAAMQTCDVLALAERRFDELSGGEARRVILAQALCQGARCLLLDEPTSGLDPAHARTVFTTLRAQCDAGAAAVVVTHDLDLALRHATEMWLVSSGELVARGAPAEVLASPATRTAFELDIHVGTLPSGGAFAVPL
jgi:ABC-type cobalamin/Fe3+-siderophores transport system ATPase subunit